MRGLILAAVAAGCGAVVAARPDDPPKKLTPDERKELLAKVKERNAAGFKAHQSGKADEAVEVLAEVLDLCRRLYPKDEYPDGHVNLATSLSNLASVHRDRGRPWAAEPLYADAVAMLKRLHKGADHETVARGLNNLATVYYAQGKLAAAEPLYADALEMSRRLHKGDHEAVAAGLNNLASLYHDQGKLAAAEPLYADALAMRKRLHQGDHEGVAHALGNLASVYRDQGKLAAAEPLLADSLRMRRRLHQGDHRDVAAGLNNLASVYHAQGKLAAAEPLLADALAMLKRLHKGADHETVARGLNNLASVYRAQGKLAAAEPLYADALRMWRRLVAEHAGRASEGEALTFVASLPLVRDAYLSNARTLAIRADRVYPEVWASKGQVARVYEQRQQAARAATDPKAAAILADLRDTRQRRAEFLLAPTPADPKTREKRAEDLEALARKIRELDEILRPLLPAVARLDKFDAATPAELRKELPAGTAFVDLLAYTRFEQDPKVLGSVKRTPSYLAFVVTAGGVAWVDLGDAGPIGAAVKGWREAITGSPDRRTPPAPPDDERKAAARVGKLVWEPVRKYLPAGVTVVYVSPDAALTGVPWGALPGADPGRILLEDHAVAVVPHGPALLDGLWPAEKKPGRPTSVLAIGGVPFGAEPAGGGFWASAAASAVTARTRGDLPVDPAKTLSWPDLPGARAEAEQLVKRAGERKLDARLLAGPAASADRVLAELGSARYAHLATHGFFADPQFRSVLQVDPKLFEVQRGGRERVGPGALNPMVMSGLVFAGANLPNTPGRGVLTGEALLDRDLSGLELAVLSACETGLGDVADGQGVLGLQRAFHVAGARNVVASLWKVPDAATAALMGEFYQHLWDEKNPLPPIEALRRAQLAVYRADPKRFAEMAGRGLGPGTQDFDKTAEAIARAPVGKDGTRRNPPVLWAAWSLSGPGTLSGPGR